MEESDSIFDEDLVEDEDEVLLSDEDYMEDSYDDGKIRGGRITKNN